MATSARPWMIAAGKLGVWLVIAESPEIALSSFRAVCTAMRLDSSHNIGARCPLSIDESVHLPTLDDLAFMCSRLDCIPDVRPGEAVCRSSGARLRKGADGGWTTEGREADDADRPPGMPYVSLAEALESLQLEARRTT